MAREDEIPISFVGSRRRYDPISCFVLTFTSIRGRFCDKYNESSCLNLQAKIDVYMSAELRQVANGFENRVKSFSVYDVNGYRFHTTRHEQSRPGRRTTNTGVFTPGTDGFDYYGRIEKIYELTFPGCIPLRPVIFKCHWFDPQEVVKTPELGLVEVLKSSVLLGDDVYIVAQQATQVYYLSYPCKTKDRLKAYDVVYKVSPHSKIAVPNDDDYINDPNTNDGEFFQEEGLQGNFEIVLDEAEAMEVYNDRVVVDGDDGEEVDNAKDLRLLEQRHSVNDDIDDETSEGHSDDRTHDLANTDDDDYF